MAPYLYVLTANALGYSLEATCISSQIHGILLLDGSEMVNNHFADDYLLSIRAEKASIDGPLACLYTFSIFVQKLIWILCYKYFINLKLLHKKH